MLYLNADAVRTAAGELDFVALVRDVLARRAQGECELPEEAYLGWTAPGGGSARSLGMQGAIFGEDGPVVGMKVINANPDNIHAGLPRAGGVTLLFDPETARIRCVMDAAHVSAMRTAAVTVLAAQLCAGRSFEVATVIGAGPLAWAHLVLFVRHFPTLRQIRVCDLDSDRADAICERATAELGRDEVSFRVAADVEPAVREADLVVPVTTTQTGYLHHDWIAPGAVLVNVSLSDVLPDSVFAFDRLFVDDWGLVAADERRTFGQLLREGRLRGPGEPGGGREVDGELASLVAGDVPGRRSETERVLVNPFGMSLHDIAVGNAVYRRAGQLGLGQELN